MSDLIPEGWKELEVREAFELGRGRVISKPEILGNPGIYPVYSSQSTNQGRMGAINTYDFDGEYITWTTDGAYAGTVFHRKGKFNCTNVCGTLKDKGTYEIHPKFVASYLETVAKNHVSYVGNPKLMNGTFSEILFLLPPLPEQQKIATILSSVDKVIETTRAQIDKLKDLKTGMMQELLTKGIGVDGVPHTEFKDSPVGRIPVGWEVAEANELCVKITKGTTPPKSKYVDDKKIPFLRVNNLGFDNQLHFENGLLYLSPEIQNGFLARSKVYPNDILMNIVGPPLGKIALVTDDFSEYNINQAIIIYRPIMDKIGYRFLLHYLTSNIAQDWLKVRSKKTSGQQNLTIELCKELPIPSPPLAEQEKISAILDSSDSMIQINKMKLNSLQNLKKALMQDLLTGKVRVAIDKKEPEAA
jgi:type I restriction enzyme S subunit